MDEFISPEEAAKRLGQAVPAIRFGAQVRDEAQGAHREAVCKIAEEYGFSRDRVPARWGDLLAKFEATGFQDVRERAAGYFARLADRRETAAQEGREADIDPPDRQLLQTMLKLNAVSSDTRRTHDDIASVNDPLDTGEIIKHRMASLVKRGLIASKTGRGGGCWLTAEGLKTVKR